VTPNIQTIPKTARRILAAFQAGQLPPDATNERIAAHVRCHPRTAGRALADLVSHHQATITHHAPNGAFYKNHAGQTVRDASGRRIQVVPVSTPDDAATRAPGVCAENVAGHAHPQDA